ncbi:MAG: diguanylate cyclase [Myxococcota bacterium]|nr:diguanylate cyclase [Myxococcota bacterium]
MTGAFRSPRNRLRWTGPFDRITSGRYTLPTVDDLSLSELGILLAAAACTALGFADEGRAPLFVGRLVAIATLPTVIAVRSYFRPSIAERRGQRSPLWIGALAVLAGVLVRAGGGPGGELVPLAFLAVGAGSLRARPAQVLPWASLLVLSVLFPVWLGWGASASLFEQLGFSIGVLLCGLVPSVAMSAERSGHEQTRAQLRAMEDEAGGLRRESEDIVPQLRGQSYGSEERDRDVRSIARELQQDMDRACALLVSATGAMTAAVYRPDGEELSERLVAVATAGDTSDLLPDVGARDGIFGAAFKAGAPVSLSSVREDDPRLVHRLNPSRIASTIALPLVDGERRWGVVILDAAAGNTLDDLHRDLAGNISDLVSRLITRAVDLTSIREGMRENHAFYEACREVAHHVCIDSIAQAVVSSAGEFVALDACAIALVDQEARRLDVVASTGFDLPSGATAIPLESGEGLLAQAVRHRTVIDRPDLQGCERPPVLFGRAAGAILDFSSLLVLPILPPGEGEAPAQGALVVARRQLPDFVLEDAERLEVLLHQVGAALSNGRLFAEHESRGVTDGMTGLPNHRHFQEVLAGKIAAAQRTGLKLSLLLLDIDKFKSVNDTYGHPMGDEVIRRLARCLEAMVREGTDLAARYGGEEFCLLLEDTDAPGAYRLSERLRAAFKEEVFVHKEQGRPVTFGCTISVGIASAPDDASSQGELIERADQALYWSKQNGRDQSTCWDRMYDRSAEITDPGSAD